MKRPSDGELLAAWRDEPAPLLPLLHAFHQCDGYLSEKTLRAISSDLGIPIADLFGTVTFYHHFARTPGGREKPRVCVGPICALRGAQEIVDGLDGATTMPCPGRCDQPVPVLDGDTILCGDTPATLTNVDSPLPPESPDEIEECVFAQIRTPGRAGLAGYRETGGYEGLARALTGSPQDLLESIDASGLAGRGGAGFPTGRKWRAVAEAEGEPKTIVCNADEGEPGCFKDRTLMDYDPHAVIEGMLAAGFATGATRGFIYLRYEYPETQNILERAIEEAQAEGLLGGEAFGPGRPFDLWVRRGAGAYICGEETSLLNSLEGKHPFPRNRPPFPVTHGYENLPTVVNNVETLASIPHILSKGPDWYRNLAIGDHAGTKVISLSGDIRRPGNYEVPLGFPLQVLLQDWAGGAPGNRDIQAVTMAGLSGGFLAKDDLDVTLDESSIRAKGSFLGAGGIMVFDDSRDMVEVAHAAMEFFAEESCGKCFPCRIGTHRLTERLSGGGPSDLGDWVDEVTDLGQTMKQTSACGLGQAAPLITESLLRYFPDQVAACVENR